MSEQWYIKTTKGKRGPYSTDRLQRYVDAGAIHPNAAIGDDQGRLIAAAKVPGLKFSADAIEKSRAANIQAQKASNREASVDSTDARRASELDKRAGELDSLANELDDRERAVSRQELNLRQREQSLDERWNELNRREQDLETQRQAIGEQEQMLQEQGRGLAEREQEVERRDAEVLRWKGEVELMRSAIDAADSQHREAEESIRRLHQSVDELRFELSSAREQIERQSALISELRVQESSETEVPMVVAVNADEVTERCSSVADDAIRDEPVCETQQDLAEAFASRQALLSERESELRRREEALERRESSLAASGQVPAIDDGSGDEIVESAQERGENTREESSPAAQGSSHDEPGTWLMVPQNDVTEADDETDPQLDDVLGSLAEPSSLAGADASQNESRDPPSQVAEKDRLLFETLRSELSGGDEFSSDVSLMDMRRRVYEDRFGTCSRYEVDHDPSMRVDVSVHLPVGTRDFATLVTSGMSDYPIPMPNGQRRVRAELLLYATHVDETAIKLLRAAAKVPFREKQGLSIGMTHSLEGSETLLSGSTQRDCVYMLPGVESDSKPISVHDTIGHSIQLFWCVTITAAERKLIRSSGIHKFLSLLQQNKHVVYFDLTRECYVKRQGWFRRWSTTRPEK